MTNKQRSLRIGVLFGGRSGEHEVSLASARNVVDALHKAGHTVVPIGITREGRWLADNHALQQLTDNTTAAEGLPAAIVNGHHPNEDAWALLPQATAEAPLPAIDVIFPVLHGPYGEDGTVQGLLEMANLPYVGAGVLASAVGMDKAVAKQLFAQAGLRQAPFQVILRKRWQSQPEVVLDDMEAILSYPLFVKPANLGSSIGVSKVRDRHELAAGIDLACHYDRKILVEWGVPYAREIEVSVLGNDEPIVSVPGEIVPGNEFYDYAAKYLDDNSELIIPAPINAELTKEVQAMAITAYGAADCSGLARVDFLLDDGSKTLYLNEINTLPGFTRISMYPKLWEASGISYPELVHRLVELALERHEDRLQNATTRGRGVDMGSAVHPLLTNKRRRPPQKRLANSSAALSQASVVSLPASAAGGVNTPQPRPSTRTPQQARRQRQLARTRRRFESAVGSLPQLNLATPWRSLPLPGITAWCTSKLLSLALLLSVAAAISYLQADLRWFVFRETVQINGGSYVNVDTLYQASDLESWNIFWLRPQSIRQRLLAVPYIEDATVNIDLPNRVAITVQEEQPVALWITNEGTLWLMPDGAALPMQNDRFSSLPQIVDPAREAQAVTQPAQPAIDPGVLAAALALLQKLPALPQLRFDRDYGLNFNLPDSSTWVYWGDGTNLEAKFANLDAAQTLAQTGEVTPEIIDVRYERAYIR